MTTGKDVFMPETITDTHDPTKLGNTEDPKGSKYWEEKGKESRSKREYEDEERQAREAREREAHPPEAPFSIKGSVNLGDFDFQKQQEELRHTIDKIQEESRERISKLEASNSDYRDKVAEIRTQMIEGTLKAQIENLTKTIGQTQNPNSNFAITDRITEITQIAGMLGYTKPDPATAAESMPATLQLKMLEMEMAEKGRERQFQWDKIESERNWQIALKKLDLEAQGRRDELLLAREKRASFISPFESIGAAIAKGFGDMGPGDGDAPKVRKKAPKGGKVHNMQAGENDSGTIECPECQEAMAIAPKAKSAFCPSCEATVQIQRVPDKPPETRGLI
ncbi:MAG TPA: hypothetical protein ENI27_07980 [bacterium]|nr:hypothetical protein [bacterium]